VIDEEACSGCKLCINACPYGCMAYNELKGTAGKCDLCTDRIQHGLEPACVQHCIGGALQLVTHEELVRITQGEHTHRRGAVTYVSSKWRLASKDF